MYGKAHVCAIQGHMIIHNALTNILLQRLMPDNDIAQTVTEDKQIEHFILSQTNVHVFLRSVCRKTNATSHVQLYAGLQSSRVAHTLQCLSGCSPQGLHFPLHADGVAQSSRDITSDHIAQKNKNSHISPVI